MVRIKVGAREGAEGDMARNMIMASVGMTRDRVVAGCLWVGI